MDGRAILVVDDDEGTRFVVRRVLREMGGFHIHEAASAEAAIEMLARLRVDVVLSDFRMDGRTGVELLCHVMERQPRAMRVLMSGTLDEARLHEAAMEACVGHAFEKPLRLAEWEDALRVALAASPVSEGVGNEEGLASGSR